eukprot:3932549-Rhodomonas_salina.1
MRTRSLTRWSVCSSDALRGCVGWAASRVLGSPPSPSLSAAPSPSVSPGSGGAASAAPSVSLS